MTKTEQAKQLMELATNGNRRPGERLEALNQADDLRKQLKVGWSKICAMDAKNIEEMRQDLIEALAKELADEDEVDSEFEMTQEELDAQTMRSKRTELGAQYKALVGYDPFEDDPLVSVEEVERMLADYEAEVRKSVPFEEMTWNEKVEMAVSLGFELPSVVIDPRPLETSEGEYGRWHQTDDGPVWVKANEAEVDAWLKAGELADRVNAQLSHQEDFVPPTVVSEPEADKPEPEASEAPQKLSAAERGAIGVMSRDLLQTSMSYEDIALAIRERYPHAKTTARSLASVAADMRRDGIPCPSRRKGGK